MAEKGLIALLEELISLPSVNPEHSKDVEINGESRVASFLHVYLESLGFDVEIDTVEEGRCNVIGRIGPDDPVKSIMLEAHMDTVGVAGMSIAPFSPVIQDNRLYGRGACDDKGPMAAALWALRDGLAKKVAERGIQIIFVGAAGEETGNLGALKMQRDGVGADWAIVLEPTGLDIVHAHKGACWFEIRLDGVSAHGSSPERGVNAINGMARVIRMLEDMVEEDRKKLQSPLLGGPTLNIGTIHGGEAINIVANACALRVDRRMLPGESCEGILSAVRSRLAALQAEGKIHTFDVTVVNKSSPFVTDHQSDLIARLAATCRKHAIDTKQVGASWFSDAGPLAEICGHTIVFGPGDIRQAHTKDEFIDLDSLQKGADILKTFFEDAGANSLN